MRERVEKVLEEIRPFLQRDGGDVELLDVTEENVVQVRLRGACGSCPGATMTLKNGIERTMKERIPEIRSVENVPYFTM
ncbi:NifU family protein [Candidatus Magnetaquicoccus inordinatus]|uniref:NifU family protein n=1 Tax=Candidatus Magnetaquicoccus inordinatus TaxID=2496818 RepID=UPI00102D2198|nr:NifU family protein [Candidatus Magnetaquicoccus inordinatus]